MSPRGFKVRRLLLHADLVITLAARATRVVNFHSAIVQLLFSSFCKNTLRGR